jgi:hypothetical protein
MPESAYEATLRAIVHKRTTEFKVQQWLRGIRDQRYRPTLAELEECGYRVVKGSPEAQSAKGDDGAR